MSFGQATVVVTATLLMASTPTLAWANHRMASRFQREVFGRWIRLATRLRLMIGAVFLYYLLVVGHGMVTGTMADLFRFPISNGAWALYGRILVSTVVYALMLGVGSAMRDVVRP